MRTVDTTAPCLEKTVFWLLGALAPLSESSCPQAPGPSQAVPLLRGPARPSLTCPSRSRRPRLYISKAGCGPSLQALASGERTGRIGTHLTDVHAFWWEGTSLGPTQSPPPPRPPWPSSPRTKVTLGGPVNTPGAGPAARRAGVPLGSGSAPSPRGGDPACVWAPEGSTGRALLSPQHLPWARPASAQDLPVRAPALGRLSSATEPWGWAVGHQEDAPPALAPARGPGQQQVWTRSSHC